MSSEGATADSEYDQRQFTRMQETIAAFERGTLRLPTLIKNLEALLDLVRSVDPAWRGQFEHEWGKIEDAYAVALDRGTTDLDTESTALVRGALASLRKLISEKLQQ